MVDFVFRTLICPCGEQHSQSLTGLVTGKWVKREFRLTRSADFERVRQSGKSYPHPLVVLLALPNDSGMIRIGIAAGRSVGNAVIRNRAKRLLRACVASLLPKMAEGWDLVLLARKPLPTAGYLQTLTALEATLKRAGLLTAR